MFESIKRRYRRTAKTIKQKMNSLTQPVRFITLCYALVVFTLVCTYYSVWVIMWLDSKESLPNLLALIKELTGPAVVAFVTFIASSFIDSDGDGIPDSIDRHDDRPQPTPPERKIL